MANEFIIRKGFKSLQDSQITGSLNLSGDLEVLGSISGDITGSASTASYIELSNVDGSASLASRIFTNSSSIASLETVSGSYANSASFASDISTNSASIASLEAISGSYANSSSFASDISTNSSSIASLEIVSGSYANSSSFASDISANSASIGSLNAVSSSYLLNTTDTLTGDLTVTGNIIATTLNVQDVTASVIYSSGSNIFGSSSIDTQQFTGSILTSGSIEVNGDKFTVNGATGNATFAGTITSTSTSTNTLAGKLRINGTTTTGLEIASSSGSSSGLKLYNDSSNDHAYILNHYNGNLVLGTSNAAVITLNGTTATFAGDVTATANYSAGNSKIIYKAQRSGGAVAGDWSYDDATTDMSLGTSTAHSFSLKTGDTRALTLNSSQNASFVGDSIFGGTVIEDPNSLARKIEIAAASPVGLILNDTRDTHPITLANEGAVLNLKYNTTSMLSLDGATSAATFAGDVTINKASNPTSLQIGSSLADDPFIVFQTDGNTMSMGIDRSDSNKFVISDNATLGTNNRLTIDTTGNATFSGEISSGDDINVVNGKLTVNNTSAEVRIKSTSDTGESFINFADPSDNNVGQIYYGHDTNKMTFATSDADRLFIEVNGIYPPIGPTTGTTYYGYNAGLNVGSNSHNTFYGYYAGRTNTGTRNVFIGSQTAYAVTNNVNYSVIIGYNALKTAANTADSNVIIGDNAMGSSSGASNGIVIGQGAATVMTGDNNTVVGFEAYRSGTTGAYNVLMGYQVGYAASQINAIMIGFRAGYVNTTNSCVYIGGEAGRNNTSGASNVFIGADAGYANVTGASNSYVGTQAGIYQVGSFNTALGASALRGTSGASSGPDNTAVGYTAGQAITTGQKNTLMGANAGRLLTSGSFNIAIGQVALANSTTDNHNIAIGRAAMQASTNGSQNIAIGTDTLEATSATGNVVIGYRAAIGTSQSGNYNNIIGHEAAQNLDNGEQNDIIGRQAGYGLTNGSSNVTIGYQSMYSNSIGSNCVAVGWRALHSDPSPEESVAVGHQALFNQLSGRNTAVGFHTLQDLTTGQYNTAVGGEAAENITTGNYNVAMGSFALRVNTDGDSNVAIGYGALIKATNSSYNTAIGYDAYQAVTTGTSNTGVGGSTGTYQTGNYNTSVGYNSNYGINGQSSGDYNTMMGYWAGKENKGENNTCLGALAGRFMAAGDRNTIVGSQAADNRTITANDNTIMGFAAGQNITSGHSNIFIGANAAQLLQTGFENIYIGFHSGKNAQGGNYNTALGVYALREATTADRCTAIGRSSLISNTTGDFNTALGMSAGENNSSGSNNVFLGYNSGTSHLTGSNTIIIGSTAQSSSTSASNEITLGNSSIGTLRCQVTSITSLSDKRDKTNIKDSDYGLNVIDALRPVTFDWNHRDKSENKGKKDVGFIAQELQEIDDESLRLVYSENPEKLEATYGRLIPVMVKAIQELKADNDNLKAEIEILKNK